MTNAIPDEIRQKALTVAVDCLNTSGFGDETKYARVIARALMAQHNAALEEAAKVAETFTNAQHVAHDMETGLFPTQSRSGVAIATTIRNMKVKADE